jgi:crotonobetainyl-CoA:carnitine CoA-transferase CaiB-like acyl-CoA transferase
MSVRGYADFSHGGEAEWRPTPDLGVNSVEVLGAFGVPPDRIAELMATGAVFVASETV